jgi:hypothetical protein
MGKRNLDTRELSLKNLKARPVRTACLVAVVTILALPCSGDLSLP